jgi:hypothetical protein
MERPADLSNVTDRLVIMNANLTIVVPIPWPGARSRVAAEMGGRRLVQHLPDDLGMQQVIADPGQITIRAPPAADRALDRTGKTPPRSDREPLR